MQGRIRSTWKGDNLTLKTRNVPDLAAPGTPAIVDGKLRGWLTVCMDSASQATLPQSDDQKAYSLRQLPVFSLANPSALNTLSDQLLSDHQDVAETALLPSDDAKRLHF